MNGRHLVAFLHFGSAENPPMSTLSVPVRETIEPRKGRTAHGYGAALPTPYQVKLNGRWRRVRVACYGNSGTAYIGRPGAWEARVDVGREESPIA